MTNTYLVVRNGVSKKTGAVYSVANRVFKSKDGTSEWIDSNDKFWLDDARPVGTIVNVEQMEV